MNIDQIYAPNELPSFGQRPSYNLLNTGRGREISDLAVKGLHLSEAEVSSLQSSVDTLFSRMESLAAAHTEEDPLRTDPQKRIVAFRQLLPEEECTRVLVDFETNVRAHLDYWKARQALLSFNWWQYFGAFGRHEVLVQFSASSDFPDVPLQATYEERDPRTGAKISGGTNAYEAVADQIGHAFQVKTEGGDQ
ncbi:MAG: hypothetical protein R3F19_30070 [Verrucomicrobiales bacterium]